MKSSISCIYSVASLLMASSMVTSPQCVPDGLACCGISGCNYRLRHPSNASDYACCNASDPCVYPFMCGYSSAGAAAVRGNSPPTTPPLVNQLFCSDVLDQTFINGAPTPSPGLTFKYNLCIDTKSRSWRRVDAGIGDLIFNGTHLITLSTRKASCTIEAYQGDPLKAMPFTEFIIDAQATYNGTTSVDGAEADVWHAHRIAQPNERQPDASMRWYVKRPSNELVLITADIGVQPNYPQPAVVRKDFFARGNYTTTVPRSVFEKPAGVKCHVAAPRELLVV